MYSIDFVTAHKLSKLFSLLDMQIYIHTYIYLATNTYSLQLIANLVRFYHRQWKKTFLISLKRIIKILISEPIHMYVTCTHRSIHTYLYVWRSIHISLLYARPKIVDGDRIYLHFIKQRKDHKFHWILAKSKLTNLKLCFRQLGLDFKTMAYLILNYLQRPFQLGKLVLVSKNEENMYEILNPLKL